MVPAQITAVPPVVDHATEDSSETSGIGSSTSRSPELGNESRQKNPGQCNSQQSSYKPCEGQLCVPGKLFLTQK